MVRKTYTNLNDFLEIYGDSVVGISFMPKVFFYIENGIQPLYVFRKEDQHSRATFWFAKNETRELKKMWDKTRKVKD